MLRTHPIVRFLNQNRRQIRITIIAIIIFFVILRFLNNLAEKELVNQAIEENTYQMELSYSDEHKEVIEDFLEFCKEEDGSNAYALLSSECKEESFNTLEEFNTKYILKYFSEYRNCTISYISNEDDKYYYSVKISEDILSTGKLNSSSVTHFYTVIQENGVDKILIEN